MLAVDLMVDTRHMCSRIDIHLHKYGLGAVMLMDRRASTDTDFRWHVSIHCTTNSPDLAAASSRRDDDFAVNRCSISMVRMGFDAVARHAMIATSRRHSFALQLRRYFDIAAQRKW